MSSDVPTLGVEEEMLLVDPATHEPSATAPAVLLTAATGEHELRREQVETGTAPLHTLSELRSSLIESRRRLSEAAHAHGLELVATGAAWQSPDEPRLTDDERYERMAETFGPIALRQLVDGCHVHVAVPDRDAAIEVVNRVRPWLGVLLALSANSPLWDGADTGYASFRHEVWSRWPTAITAGPFEGASDYNHSVDELIRSGAAIDAGMIYFHVRPSASYPTVEFRIADVCLTVDEAVLHAALCRALTVTALRDAESGTPMPEVRGSFLRAAEWRAARYGLDGALVSAREHVLRPASAVVGELLDHVGPALQDCGDADTVGRLVTELLGQGGASRRQRAAFRRGGIPALVDLLVESTMAT